MMGMSDFNVAEMVRAGNPLAIWEAKRRGLKCARDSRSKPVRAETPQSGSVHDSGGARSAIANPIPTSENPHAQ
jgi:hypothetical protein